MPVCVPIARQDIDRPKRWNNFLAGRVYSAPSATNSRADSAKEAKSRSIGHYVLQGCDMKCRISLTAVGAATQLSATRQTDAGRGGPPPSPLGRAARVRPWGRDPEFASCPRYAHHRQRNNVFPNTRTRPIMDFKSPRRPPLEATAVTRQDIFVEARLSTRGVVSL